MEFNITATYVSNGARVVQYLTPIQCELHCNVRILACSSPCMTWAFNGESIGNWVTWAGGQIDPHACIHRMYFKREKEGVKTRKPLVVNWRRRKKTITIFMNGHHFSFHDLGRAREDLSSLHFHARKSQVVKILFSHYITYLLFSAQTTSIWPRYCFFPPSYICILAWEINEVVRGWLVCVFLLSTEKNEEEKVSSVVERGEN